MKKLFSKIDTPSKDSGHKDNNFIGKVFTVGRTPAVTIEDVLAEGEFVFKISQFPKENIKLYRLS